MEGTGDVDPGERSSVEAACGPTLGPRGLPGGDGAPRPAWASGNRVTLSGRIYRVSATQARGGEPGDGPRTST